MDLLDSRRGAKIHHVPIIKNAEQLTFAEAARAVIDNTAATGAASTLVVNTRRIEKHLMPFFGRMRLASIITADALAYIARRKAQGIVAIKGPRKDQRIADVSPAELNRELAILKRVFSLAIEHGRIAMKPHIPMLEEAPARSGFFEPDQIASVLAHLPADLRPVIEFAFLTGWRIASEVLPLEWRQVDFAAGEVRLFAGTTKNGDGRVIYMSTELRTVLEAQHVEHERMKKQGTIFPSVFFRLVANGRGGTKAPKVITSFGKAWKRACVAAGLPDRIPHDLRRTAVRNLVRAGIPERVAMLMTGHKTRSVFERYNIVSDSDLKEAAAKLNAAAGQ